MNHQKVLSAQINTKKNKAVIAIGNFTF